MAKKTPDMKTFPTFGSLLAYLRRREQLTQMQLGIATGYSEAQISRLEGDKRSCSRETVLALLVPALHLEEEPEVVARMLVLAEKGREDGEKEKESLAGSAEKKRHNLPLEMTSLVGREAELAEIAMLLGQPTTRLLTLTGAGGCGKTRLALRSGRNLAGEYPQGVWLVELAPLSDPDLVLHTVISALDILGDPGRSPQSALVEFLRECRLLLILDNCEHLLDACASLSLTLLQACPELTILATSREPLGLPGEVVWRVPSLSFPGEGEAQALSTEAVLQNGAPRLFVERAQAAVPGWSPEDHTACLVEICRRLDGIPLAIELAASRLRALSVEQIAARLRDAFRLLAGGVRTALPRHQTLLACIDWSYRLLTEPEQVLLRRLSVFQGGWTLEAAECLSEDPQDVLDLLARLVDRSLVVASPSGEQETRYRLLETIRLFAQGKLVEAGEEAQARQQHLAYYRDLAVEAQKHLRRRGQAEWLDRLQSELDNLRAAMEWGLAHDVAGQLRIASDMHQFWHIRNMLPEGLRWLERGLEVDAAAGLPGAASDPDHTLLRGNALVAAMFLASNIPFFSDGDIPEEEERKRIRTIQEHLIEAEDLLQGMKEARLPLMVNMLSVKADLEADPLRQQSLREEGIAIARQTGDGFLLAGSLDQLTLSLEAEGKFGEALPLLEETLALYQAAGDDDGAGHILRKIGIYHYLQNDIARAEFFLSEALSCSTRVGNRNISRRTAIYLCLCSLALEHGPQALKAAEALIATAINPDNKDVLAYGMYFKGWALFKSDPVQAWECLRSSLPLKKHLDSPEFRPYLLDLCSHIARQNGLVERAAVLFGAAAQIEENTPWQIARTNAHRQALVAALGEAAFSAALEKGRTMTVERAVEYAFEGKVF